MPGRFNLLTVVSIEHGTVRADFESGNGHVSLPRHDFARGWADWSGRTQDPATGALSAVPPDDGADR